VNSDFAQDDMFEMYFRIDSEDYRLWSRYSRFPANVSFVLTNEAVR
jgi:hypothetical protein